MIKQKKIFFKIAIDSPAASGAGTLAKSLAEYYNLAYLDTGKAYRLVALYKLNNPNKFNLKFLKKKIKNLKLKDLNKKILLSDEVGIEASIIAKNKNIRNLIHSFQINFAYNPAKKYNGSVLDGRDITYNIVPDADFKFFITANVKTRAMRRYKELIRLNKSVTFKEVLKSIKNRDKSDYNRKIAPLKKTKDSMLINTTKLSKRACFLKIKKIIDRKINT
tara:strand:- start:753 stop:1412 length:660 start_codon:yes stop_codon:yes gene_type:complete